MNNSKKCKIMSKTINRVFDEYPNIRELIDRSMADIYRSEIISPHQVFCFSLLLSVFYCHKPKIENDVFDYRFVIFWEIWQRKKAKEGIKEELINSLKESDDEYDPSLLGNWWRHKKVRRCHSCHQALQGNHQDSE